MTTVPTHEPHSRRDRSHSPGARVLAALLTFAALTTGGCKLTPDPAIVALFEGEQEPADSAAVELKAPTTRPSTRSEAELGVWRDPEFKRRFAESYIAATDVEPPVTEDERKKLIRVQELLSEERMDAAAGLLQQYRDKAATAAFDLMLAKILFQNDQLEDAAAAYGIAVEKFPNFRRAWKDLGLIHVRLERHGKAIEALTRVVELGGGDAVTYGLLGYSYASQEDYLAAESAYRNAILLDPDTMDWKKGLAQSFFRQRRYSQAVAICDTLIAEYPDNAELWLLQANAYIGMKQPLKAAENFELVDTLGAATADSLNTLGDIYINEELYELAVDSYIRALEKKPDGSVDRALRAASVLTGRGDHEHSRRLIEYIETHRGAQLADAQRKDLLKLQARLAVARGADDEQARVLEEIVSIDPMDGEALLLLGQHYARKGDDHKAVFYFERAASIEEFEADANVRHAQLLAQNRQYDKALPLLRRAQQLKPRENVEKYLQQVERAAKIR